MVGRRGCYANKVAKGIIFLLLKAEGVGDPMKLRPLTVLSQIYHIDANLVQAAGAFGRVWISPPQEGD